MTHTDEVPNVSGLSMLIRSMAQRIEGEVDGLSKSALEQWATRMARLENVAEAAATVFKTCGHSKVSARMIVDEEAMQLLRVALQRAGFVLCESNKRR